MRKLLLIAITFFCVIATTTKVSAETLPALEEPTALSHLKDIIKEKPPDPPSIPQPVEYIVVTGDNLTKVAKAQNVPIERLWAKNLHVTDPDTLKPGDKLVVPLGDELLEPRAMPVDIPPVSSIAPVRTGVKQPSPAPKATIPKGNSSGNTYTPGQCTWYVKNRKSSLPNGLGNADTWYSRARSMGLATGTTPRAGAAAPRKYGMHVVYVEAVHGDGTITISEMNYNYTPYATRTRIANAADYYYIY